MHYTAMLCYRGLGDTEKAAREEKLFRRFKADESAQAITAKRRMAQPRRQQRAPDDPRARERAAGHHRSPTETEVAADRRRLSSEATH